MCGWRSLLLLQGRRGRTGIQRANVHPSALCIALLLRSPSSTLQVSTSPQDGVQTGVRTKLPSYAPPYPQSTAINATVDNRMIIGINGDEFPITWGKDGNQYTGAGDNTQPNQLSSPASFFQVTGGPLDLNCTNPPTHGDQPSPACSNIRLQGAARPVVGADVRRSFESLPPVGRGSPQRQVFGGAERGRSAVLGRVVLQLRR